MKNWNKIVYLPFIITTLHTTACKSSLQGDSSSLQPSSLMKINNIFNDEKVNPPLKGYNDSFQHLLKALVEDPKAKGKKKAIEEFYKEFIQATLLYDTPKAYSLLSPSKWSTSKFPKWLVDPAFCKDDPLISPFSIIIELRSLAGEDDAARKRLKNILDEAILAVVQNIQTKFKTAYTNITDRKLKGYHHILAINNDLISSGITASLENLKKEFTPFISSALPLLEQAIIHAKIKKDREVEESIQPILQALKAMKENYKV